MPKRSSSEGASGTPPGKKKNPNEGRHPWPARAPNPTKAPVRPPTSAWLYWLTEVYGGICHDYDGSISVWDGLTSDEKEKYRDMARGDHTREQKQLDVWVRNGKYKINKWK